ncbi:MAG TPA: methyl-accepting chemotaxis protein [Melioribacteraceae bacterium]|nr:methyl-accepting chemotaxis protein [Melioribacteraceae bacterium]
MEFGFNNLARIILELNAYFKKSITNINNDKNELLKILGFIENISNEISNFKKIVKHLRVLGISTKIEIARLGTDDKGFSALVQNVDRLSEIIEQKAGNISQQANYLISEISRTNLDLDNLFIEQDRLSKNVLDSAAVSLEEFKNQYNKNKNFIEGTFENTKSITSNIGDVVVAIQFHDITRQQIEHINEAFNHLLEEIKLEDEDTKLNETIYDICEIQAEQLNHTADKFGEAVQDIIEKLNLIAKDFDSIFIDSEKLYINSHSNGKTQLESVCSKLMGISEALGKNVQIEEHLNKSINTAVDIVEELARYVQEIENIGDEIEIIALNAIVKAAHVGNEGSALGILAESIQKLSIEAKEQTGSITTKLENVNAIAQGLRLSLNNSSIKDELISEKELKVITDKILKNESEAKRQFLSLNNDISAISKGISYFSSKINIHNKFLEIIYNIVSDINSILINIHPQIKPRTKREFNDVLYKKYTMKSEREIHEKVINRKSISKEENKNTNLEFGDNIELF